MANELRIKTIIEVADYSYLIIPRTESVMIGYDDTPRAIGCTNKVDLIVHLMIEYNVAVGEIADQFGFALAPLSENQSEGEGEDDAEQGEPDRSAGA